jgi:type IV secretory pathway VirB2 component (pilin)
LEKRVVFVLVSSSLRSVRVGTSFAIQMVQPSASSSVPEDRVITELCEYFQGSCGQLLLTNRNVLVLVDSLEGVVDFLSRNEVIVVAIKLLEQLCGGFDFVRVTRRDFC